MSCVCCDLLFWRNPRKDLKLSPHDTSFKVQDLGSAGWDQLSQGVKMPPILSWSLTHNKACLCPCPCWKHEKNDTPHPVLQANEQPVDGHVGPWCSPTHNSGMASLIMLSSNRSRAPTEEWAHPPTEIRSDRNSSLVTWVSQSNKHSQAQARNGVNVSTQKE